MSWSPPSVYARAVYKEHGVQACGIWNSRAGILRCVRFHVGGKSQAPGLGATRASAECGGGSIAGEIGEIRALDSRASSAWGPTFAKSLGSRSDASRPVHLSSVIQKKQSDVSTFSSTNTCATPSGCSTCGCVGRIRRLGKRVQCHCRATLEAASSIAVLMLEWPSNTWDAD